jgi:protein SCO1/2
MRSNASRCRRREVSFKLVGLAAVLTIVLGAGSSRAQSVESLAIPEGDALAPESFAIPTPYSERFPNVVLKTHEGRNVRFYDDLLKDKIVLINFFYVTCSER